MKEVLATVTVALALAVAACSPPPPLPDEPKNAAPTKTRQRVLPTFESEVGALDATKVQAVFDKTSGSLQECYARGVGRIGFLAGEIRLAVRVAQDGSTKHAFVKDSTLGDRATEECMLAVVKLQTWPQPQGGREGNAETSFTFEPGDEERPPVEWNEGRMGDGFKKARGALVQCRKSAGAGPMKVTLYVETDGKALGVGVSGADAKSEDAVTCVIDVLMRLKYASPGSYAAKVSVAID